NATARAPGASRPEPASSEEQHLAGLLIEAATKPVAWTDYRDDSAEQLRALIQAKLHGRTLTAAAAGIPLRAQVEWHPRVSGAPGARLGLVGPGASRLPAPMGESIAVLRGHGGAVHSVAFSLDGARIASASADGTVRLWDVEAARRRAVLRGHTGY